jgi:menaquinone-dependent protoporphyrinogen oxidase
VAVELKEAKQVHDLAGYDAFVIGAAAYNGHWMKEATELVRRNRHRLRNGAVWLFSSGPIGTDTVDAKGRDVLEVSRPKEFEDFARTVQPRDQRVFFGAYDPDDEPVGLAERLGARFTKLAAVREAIPSGDFRDWPQIDAWADGIADDLPSPAS